MSPEEQPAKSNRDTALKPVCVCVYVCTGEGAWSLTSSGCRSVWCPAPTLWSGPRWRQEVDPWRAWLWWPSARPGVPSVIPTPRSPGTTRYRLHGTCKHLQSRINTCSIWAVYVCEHERVCVVPAPCLRSSAAEFVAVCAEESFISTSGSENTHTDKHESLSLK